MAEGQFSIKFNDRGGIPYRDYNPTTFQKLFNESRTAANFELMVLIEGLTFLAYFIYCQLKGKPEKYNEILNDPTQGSFKSVTDLLFSLGIISEELKNQLHEYRIKRNKITHNWLKIKTPLDVNLKEYSFDEALKDLFDCGMNVLPVLHKAVTPTKDTWIDYLKRFAGLYKNKI